MLFDMPKNESIERGTLKSMRVWWSLIEGAPKTASPVLAYEQQVLHRPVEPTHNLSKLS